MRERNDIENEQQDKKTGLETPADFTQRNTRLILEVLLDIRDLLIYKNK